MTPRTSRRRRPLARTARPRRLWPARAATTLWLGVVFLQGALPTLHALAPEGPTCGPERAVSPSVPEARAAGGGSAAIRASAPRADAPSHDAATCPVCRALQQHGAVLPPADGAAVALTVSAGPGFRGDTRVTCGFDAGPGSPRAPPARA